MLGKINTGLASTRLWLCALVTAEIAYLSYERVVELEQATGIFVFSLAVLPQANAQTST